MEMKFVRILGILTVLTSSLAQAQSPKHAEAEEALAKIVLEKSNSTFTKVSKLKIGGTRWT